MMAITEEYLIKLGFYKVCLSFNESYYQINLNSNTVVLTTHVVNNANPVFLIDLYWCGKTISTQEELRDLLSDLEREKVIA